MQEAWLRPNYRVLLAATVLPALLLVAGLSVAWATWRSAGSWPLLVLGGGLAALGAAALLNIVLQLRTPRLAYEDGHLLVYLRGAEPFRLPVELVECFFSGQAPSLPSPAWRQARQVEARTIVVRLAESAEQWKSQPVRASLGRWCDGYITIRGTWCEPISGALVQRLNRRLLEAHRQLRRQKAAGGESS